MYYCTVQWCPYPIIHGRRQLDAATSAELAASRTIVASFTATPRRLDPRKGEPSPLATDLLHVGLAPSLQEAFPSFKSAHRLLRDAAATARTLLPPHVLVPQLGKWCYLCFPAAARVICLLHPRAPPLHSLLASGDRHHVANASKPLAASASPRASSPAFTARLIASAN